MKNKQQAQLFIFCFYIFHFSLFIFHYTYYSHSIVNNTRKSSIGAGFSVVTSVNTMKNTIINNSSGNILQL